MLEELCFTPAHHGMRILHVASMLGSGGVERWLVDLCQEAAYQGLGMDVAVLYPGNGLFTRRAKDMNIRVFACDGAGNPWLFVQSLRRLIRQHGPYDAVHCHLHAFSGFGVLAAWLEGVPKRLAHSHNVTNIDSASLPRRVYAAVGRAFISAFATAGIGPSTDSVRDLFGSDWNKDRRWQVMRCGLRFDRFRGSPPQSVSRNDLGIPQESFVIGSVGRLNPDKNPEFLLKLLEEAIRIDEASCLVLVGEGMLHQRLQDLAAASGIIGHVYFLGERDDVPIILRNIFDVFVLASPREALPLAIVEAQAAGLPVLMSEGVPEEAIVIPSLIRRRPLSEGPKRWAEQALELRAARRQTSGDDALAQMERSDFSCRRNLELLTKLYSVG